MRKCIVLIGPPCSGKSTVGKLVEYMTALHDPVHQFKYISSGDVARSLVSNGGDMDNLIAGKMADECKMRREMARILRQNSNVVLDGMPRFEDQYRWFMDEFGTADMLFVVVDVPISQVFHRASLRGRADDVSINNRVKYYIDNTIPMIQSIWQDEDVVLINNMDSDNSARRILEHVDSRWI